MINARRAQSARRGPSSPYHYPDFMPVVPAGQEASISCQTEIRHSDPHSYSLLITMIGNELIAAFRRQEDRRGTDACGQQQSSAQADRAQYPRNVQLPAREEAIVVLVEVSLYENVSHGQLQKHAIHESAARRHPRKTKRPHKE